MKAIIRNTSIWWLLLSLALSNCVNLKSVSNFATSSSEGMKKFEEVKYNFAQHCFERCQMEAIRNFDIKRDFECDCASYKKADSVTLLIYQEINGYFTGLSRLATNELTNYKVDTLQTALKEGSFGKLKIEKKHVDAYSKISNTLLRASTESYRSKKLKIYITDANAPLQILLAQLKFIIQKNLYEELSFSKEKLYTYYMDLKMNNLISDYEKRKATIEYYQQLSDINAKQAQILTFAKSLDLISEGHQKLYDRKDKMSTKEAKELLEGYASHMQDLISEFNKLKK